MEGKKRVEKLLKTTVEYEGYNFYRNKVHGDKMWANIFIFHEVITVYGKEK